MNSQRVLRYVIAVALLLALLLSGCVGNQQPSPQTNAPTVITFSAPEFYRSVYEPIIRSFNQQNNEVHVQFVAQVGTSGAARDIMDGIVRSADTALVETVNGSDIRDGLFADLSPFIDSDATFQRDDFFPGILDLFSNNDRVYLIPQVFQAPVYAYNKNVWAQRGLAVPQADWTWREFANALTQFSAHAGTSLHEYGLSDANGALLPLLGELADSDILPFSAVKDNASIDQPKMTNGIERAVALIANKAVYVWQPQSTDSGDYQQLIRDQHIAIWSPMLVDSSSLPFDVGFLPMPPVPAPYYAVMEDSKGYIISSGTRHPQAAWKWLSFLSHQNLGVASTGINLSVPARKSIAQSGYWSSLDESTRRVVQAAIERPSTLIPLSQNNESVYAALGAASDAVRTKQQTAEEVSANVISVIDEQRIAIALTPQPDAAQQPVVASPVPDVLPPGVQAIRFGSSDPNVGQVQQLATTFQRQNPDIVVQIRGVDTAAADLANQTDCFSVPTWQVPADIRTLDLQPLMNADPSFDIKDYAAPILRSVQSKGQIRGLPYSVALRMLVYDRSLFDAATVPYPNADWTVADFRAAARALTQAVGAAPQYGFAGVRPDDVLLLLDRSGATLTEINGQAVTPRFTDPAVVQAVQASIDLLKESSPTQRLRGFSRQQESNTPTQLPGRIAMQFGFGYPGAGANTYLAVAPALIRAGRLSSADIRVNGLYISASTRHAEACWQWLKFLSADVSSLQNTFPARTSVAGSAAFAAQAGADAVSTYQASLAALAAYETSSVIPVDTTSQIDYFWFFQAIDQALQGKNLRQELANAQSFTEQYLACVRGGAAGSACARQVDPNYDGLQ